MICAAQLLQVRLAERAPRVAGGGISGGAVRRFIRADERWLEFEVGCAGCRLLRAGLFHLGSGSAAAGAAACSALPAQHPSFDLRGAIASPSPPPLPAAQVEMEGQSQPVWLHRKQLKGCDALLHGFVRRLRE